MASILIHPLGVNAESEVTTDISIHGSTMLGTIPHQIRGYLSHFTNLVITGPKFDKCICCSDKILEEFRQKGCEFLKDCLYDPEILEKLSGLDELKNDCESVDVEWDEPQDF
jgi:ubiquitin-like modifier-activating enzyme ATG7